MLGNSFGGKTERLFGARDLFRWEGRGAVTPGRLGGLAGARRVGRERMCKIRWIDGIISHRIRHVGDL